MANPEWSDEELSRQISVLRDRGEGQHLEFIAAYPENGHELSKEIAAFASSNAGTILIGVADDGALLGIDEAHEASGRDLLSRRLEGVCSGNVRPSITPVIRWGIEAGKVILAIEVPRGSQPIYYSKNTPYVRHLSQSRPAQPHEVIERVEAWLGTRPISSHDDGHSQFISDLASRLIDALISTDEIEDRDVNPWLDMLRSEYSGIAADLRSMAAGEQARTHGVDTELKEIADLLDRAAKHRLYLGRESWDELISLVTKAKEKAGLLKAREIDSLPLGGESEKEVDALLNRISRELADLDERAQEMANDGRIEEVQSEASRLGRILLLLSYYKLDFLGADFSSRLRESARKLHLLETERLFIDGGASMRKILGELHTLQMAIGQLIAEAP